MFYPLQILFQSLLHLEHMKARDQHYFNPHDITGICSSWHQVAAAAAAKSLQSCPTLSDPMDWSPPGSSVLGIFQARVLEWVSIDYILFHLGFISAGQSMGASAPASVPPVNIQDWFSLGLTSLICLQSKGLSTVFSNTTVQKYQFLGAQPSLWSNSHSHTWLLENHSFD